MTSYIFIEKEERELNIIQKLKKIHSWLDDISLRNLFQKNRVIEFGKNLKL